MQTLILLEVAEAETMIKVNEPRHVISNNDFAFVGTQCTVQSLYNTPRYDMELDITQSCAIEFYKGIIGK